MASSFPILTRLSRPLLFNRRLCSSSFLGKSRLASRCCHSEASVLRLGRDKPAYSSRLRLTRNICVPQGQGCRPSSFGCKDRKLHAQTAPLLEKLQGQTTVEGLLGVVNELGTQVEPITLEVLHQLTCLHYRDLQASMPWLHSSLGIAHQQLLVSGRLKGEMLPVTESLPFKAMLKVIEDQLNAQPFSADKQNLIFQSKIQRTESGGGTSGLLNMGDLLPVFASLKNLGVEDTTPIMQSLLLHCSRNFDKIDYKSVALYTESLPHSVRLSSMRDFINTINDLLVSSPIKNKQELANFAKILNNSCIYMSAEMSSHLMSVLSSTAEVLVEESTDVAHLGSLAHDGMCLQQKIGEKEQAEMARGMVRIIVDKAHDLVDQLQPQDLGLIAYNGSTVRVRSANVISTFAKRAEQLLYSDELSVWDINYLLMATPAEPATQSLQSLLHQKLSDQPGDPILLSNLMERLTSLKLTNEDLLDHVHNGIIKNWGIYAKLESPAYIKSVMYFLAKYPFKDVGKTRGFKRALLRALDKRLDVHLHLLPKVGRYILSNTLGGRDELPEEMFPIMEKALPRLLLEDLHRLTIGLQSYHKKIYLGSSRKMSASERRQLMRFQGLLYQAVSKRLDIETPTVGLCLKQVRMLLSHKHFQEPFLIERYMRLIEKCILCGEPTFGECQTVTKLLGKTSGFLLPDIYDELTRIFSVKTDVQPLIPFTYALANANYVPKDCETLVSSAVRALAAMKSPKKKYFEMLILNNLSVLQYFPEKQIKEILNEDVLCYLDTFKADFPEERVAVEKAFVELNRAVVIERPEWNLPWFQARDPAVMDIDNYRKTKQNEEQKSWHKEVRQILENFLGGRSFVQVGQVTKYFHYIDLECHFVDDQPVVYENRAMCGTDNLQVRVAAILLLGKADYCFNSQHPRGHTVQKERQLRSMGYDVVQVPYYDWFSMEFDDESVQATYLKKKIGYLPPHQHGKVVPSRSP